MKSTVDETVCYPDIPSDIRRHPTNVSGDVWSLFLFSLQMQSIVLEIMAS